MGLEPGETPYDSVEEISANYFDGLGSATGQHPRVIGGICLGGLLAIEVGRLTHAEWLRHLGDGGKDQIHWRPISRVPGRRQRPQVWLSIVGRPAR